MRIDAELLIPGRGEPIEDGALVLDGEIISYVGPASDAPSEPSSSVTALMPGLWDVHTHFWGLDDPSFESYAKTHAAIKTAWAVADVKEALFAGVTSCREVGGVGLYLRLAVEAGRLLGPNIYAAGKPLSPTGGHGDVHGFPLDWVTNSGHGVGQLCDGVPECLKAVRTQLRRGADLIKVVASGGVGSDMDHPIHQQFSPEELTAIVEEAGRAERIVAAHCHGKPGIMAALEAGAKTIEHGSYLDEEAATAMVETDAILVPTRFIADQALGMEERWPPHIYQKFETVAATHAEALSLAIERGVTIAMGSDSLIEGTGRLRTTEVRLLIEAGMTPLAAIEAATANGPLTLGPRAPKSGLLAEGYDADVIALDTNPLGDITIWGDPDRITQIWKAGTLVKGH